MTLYDFDITSERILDRLYGLDGLIVGMKELGEAITLELDDCNVQTANEWKDRMIQAGYIGKRKIGLKLTRKGLRALMKRLEVI